MNGKSIFKKLSCPSCRRWEPDETGKAVKKCHKCGGKMFHSVKWHVRITRQGKTSVKSVSSRRQEAAEYLHAAKDAIRRGQLLPGEEKLVPWSEATREFTKWIESSDLAPKTKEFYSSRLKHLDAFFDEALQSITVRRVEAYRDSRTAAPKTVSEEIKTLKRVYSLFCRWYPARVAPDLHAVAADLSTCRTVMCCRASSKKPSRCFSRDE